MSAQTFLALLVFALVASITPGPNNVMLLASGTNFGFRRTIPHMAGIALGFCMLLLAVGFGLGTILSTYPVLHEVLKIAGGAYLLYLAFRVATTRTASARATTSAHPMTAIEAAAFQWVNPKAWVLAVSAMAVYADPERPYSSVTLVALSFTLMSLPSVLIWAGFGVALRTFLADPVRLVWFNRAMGLLLALTLIPLLA